jgi:RNA polymerase sigma factor (TIGR02999 family)
MRGESRHLVSDLWGIMMSADDTTELLLALRGGDRRALDRLMPRVYDELRRIAHRELARRGGGGTLRTTGLVHEVYLKLVDQSRVEVADRAHFFALAATAMRHIVIDYARARRTQKRGGGWQRISLDDGVPASEERFDEMIELDDALKRLERFDGRLCKVVECRFFGGMSAKETALALAIAPRTVDRAWQKAKAWLYREIHET